MVAEYRSCLDCGSAWFVLAPGETRVDNANGTVAGAVCLGIDNEVIAWSGVLVCSECHKVADPQARVALTLVPRAVNPDLCACGHKLYQHRRNGACMGIVGGMKDPLGTGAWLGGTLCECNDYRKGTG